MEENGELTSAGMAACDDPGCDALRRRSLANPVALAPGTEEAELIRRGGPARGGGSEAPSALPEALGLEHHAMAAVVPESRTVALIVLDRSGPPVAERDRCTLELFAHLLGLAVERLVLRLRLRELSMEFRHLTASAHALMTEAIESPVTLTTDHGHGPVFTTAGRYAVLPSDLGTLLNEREREIAALMADGRSNREIADELHLAPDTVKAQVARLVRKLGASNRVEAVARYVGMSQAAEGLAARDRAAPTAPPRYPSIAANSRSSCGYSVRWSSLRPALTWRLKSSTTASGSPASTASSAAAATAAGAILSTSRPAVRSVSTKPTWTPTTCVP